MLRLTKAQMQLAEKLADQSGLTYPIMMQNAGVAAFQYLKSEFGDSNQSCVILAGNGNNAGDGFVMAKLFCNEGFDVTLILCMSAPKTPLAIAQFALLKDLNITVIDSENEHERAKSAIASSGLLIDAIFGIGFSGELPSGVAAIVHAANAVDAIRVSLDIPSGADVDSGKISGACFQAELTLSFGAYKYAHSMLPAMEKCGKVVVLDIGISGEIIHAVQNHVTKLSDKLVAPLLPLRKADSNKGDFGKLLNISGAATMAGAAMMSTLAAMRVGTGIVRLATTASVAGMVAPHLMEAMTCGLAETKQGSISMDAIDTIEGLLQKSTGCLIGCGLSVNDDTKHIVEYVVENTNCSVVIDADGLNCLVDRLDLLKSAKYTPIITPHIGEMARLVGMSVPDVIQNAQRVARVFAKEYQTVVVLKSHKTLIATP